MPEKHGKFHCDIESYHYPRLGLLGKVEQDQNSESLVW